MMDNISIRVSGEGTTIKIFHGTKDFQGNIFINRDLVKGRDKR